MGKKTERSQIDQVLPPHRPNVLVLVFSDLTHDGRVKRQVKFLSSSYHVFKAGFETGMAMPNVTFIPLNGTKPGRLKKIIYSIFIFFRLFKLAYHTWYPFRLLLLPYFKKADIIICNDVETLPLAFDQPYKRPVILDAHEYSPLHFQDRLYWRLLFKPLVQWTCKTYLGQVDQLFVVADGIGQAYKDAFKVNYEIMTNAPEYIDIKPTLVNPEKIRIIHHGIYNQSRNIEKMMDVANLLDSRFSLDLMLLVPPMASSTTRQHFEQFKARVLQTNGKVNWIEPVKSEEVVKTISVYDIGLFILEPVTINYTYALPNKLFEFIQARLMVAIGPSPEMKNLVLTYKCGIITEDFEASSMAKALNALNQHDIFSFKNMSHIAAADLNASINEKKLLKAVDRLIVRA